VSFGYAFYFELEYEMSLRQNILDERPLVLNIANSVTQQHVADVVSMLGASPLVTSGEEEINALVDISQALVLNIGTVNNNQIKLLKLAGEFANAKGIPVVLDPVAVQIPYRAACIEELSELVHFDFIRGNAAEIAWFAKASQPSKGVDSLETEIDLEITRQAASATGAVVLQSGAVDVISDGERVVTLDQDNPLLSANVGGGDMLSAVLATFASVADDRMTAAIEAGLTMNIAGQQAMEVTGPNRPGSYMGVFFDKLYALRDNDMTEGSVTWH